LKASGYVHSEEVRLKISAAHKGKKFSEERCGNLRIAAIAWHTRKKLEKEGELTLGNICAVL
jgi:hypothetical protein